MLPRDDSQGAKKTEARKTKDLEHISLGEFLKESKNDGGIGADGAGDADIASKGGSGKDEGGKKSDDVK